MSGPRVTSGTESKQDYATPDQLIGIVAKRFGPISFDLAAHSGNKKHPRYFAPWADRCLSEMRDGANITLLTPMTTANWFRDNIAGEADAYPLSGRLSFDGKNVFPKDCLVSRYSPDSNGDFFLWDWQKDVILRKWIRDPRS